MVWLRYIPANYVFFCFIIFILIGMLSHFIIVLIFVSLMTEYAGHGSFIDWSFEFIWKLLFKGLFSIFDYIIFMFLVFEFFILGLNLLLLWAETDTHPVCFATQKYFKLMQHNLFSSQDIELISCEFYISFPIHVHYTQIHDALKQ